MAKKKTLAKLEITVKLVGKTVIDILKEDLNISSRQRQKIIRTKGVSLDGRLVHSQTVVKVGQILEVKLPQAEQVKVTVKPLALDIIYEDDNLLVVNKPAGVVVHHIKINRQETSLVQGVAHYYQQQGLVITPRPVHRLDKDASGLVVFAKSAMMQEKLTAIWTQITKLYWVQVSGRVEQGGEITTPIKGKHARTKYVPLQVSNDLTTLRVQIYTGRTNQIRIHLAQLGFPVVGDRIFGLSRVRQRLALHCWQISFDDPLTNELRSFIAPIPQEFSTTSTCNLTKK